MFLIPFALVLLGGCCHLFLLEGGSQRDQRALLNMRADQLRTELFFLKVDSVGSYLDRLPHAPGVDSFMKSLRQACEFNAVTIRSVSVADVSAVPTMLSRKTFNVGLSGSYDGIKQVLADVAGRHSDQLLLQSFSIRHSASKPTLVDANVELALLGLPDSKRSSP
jgi:Tfp pilus assembly protein PilO